VTECSTSTSSSLLLPCLQANHCLFDCRFDSKQISAVGPNSAGPFTLTARQAAAAKPGDGSHKNSKNTVQTSMRDTKAAVLVPTTNKNPMTAQTPPRS
jgi:hypothetical protein